MPLLLLAGLLGGGILVLTARKKKQEAAAQRGDGVTTLNGVTVDLTNLNDLQKSQIQKFSGIAAIAGSTATALASAGILGGVAATSTTAATGAIALAGPIGATIAAVIVAIAVFRGTAHLVANVWTAPGKGVQDLFNRALGAIVDANAAAVQEGSATQRSARLAKDAINRLYAQYRAAAEQFAARGPDYREVIDHSYDKLNPILAQINHDVDVNIATLPY